MSLVDIAHLIPGYDPWRDSAGWDWTPAPAEKALEFFDEVLTFADGPKAGESFQLEDWQKAIVVNLYGWHSGDRRRYREAMVMVPRKNGKTPTLAGLLLHEMVCHPTPGGQYYSAAADRDQAALIYRDAAKMVGNDDLLSSLFSMTPSSKLIQRKDTGQFFKALSSEAHTKHGLRPCFVAVDELHAHPNAELVDTLTTGTAVKGMQPLVIYITTADYNRESVCNTKYKYACGVRDGKISDPAFLPVIYEAHSSDYTERLFGVSALQEMEAICSCSVPRDVVVRNLQKGCARGATTNSGANEDAINHPASGAEGTQIELCEHAACAQRATNNGCLTETPNTRLAPLPSERSGKIATQNAGVQPSCDGSTNPETAKYARPEGESLFTESRNKNMPTYLLPRAAGALSAESRRRWESIIATKLEQLGDCSVQDAIPALGYSEILKSAYNSHESTCNVRRLHVESSVLVVERQADDWTSPDVWKRANPNYGISVSEDYLLRECERAKVEPSYQNTFKRLHLNIQTESVEAWFRMDQWDDCGEDTVSADMLRNNDCFAGLDMSSTKDITAFVLYFPDGGYVLPYFWLPGETAEERQRKDGVPYTEWTQGGLIIETDKNHIDDDAIFDKICELGMQFNIRQIAFDGWQAASMFNRLAKHGFDAVKFPQSINMMNSPSKRLETMLANREIRHGGNPVLRWMATNTVKEQDNKGFIRPSKKHSSEKIDGIAALIMAIGAADASVETPFAYEVW